MNTDFDVAQIFNLSVSVGIVPSCEDFSTAENGATCNLREAFWSAAVPCRFRIVLGPLSLLTAREKTAAQTNSGRGLPHSKTLRAVRLQLCRTALYRRFAIGRAPKNYEAQARSRDWRNTIPRYSRLKICATII